MTRNTQMGTWLLCIGALACGDTRSPRDEPPCAQLQRALCERTTTCAVGQGLTPAVDAEVFTKRCLRAVESTLQCTEAVEDDSYDAADFALCEANLEELSCERVVAALEQEVIVAPSTSCSGLFVL
jgi:hypothetical protein